MYEQFTEGNEFLVHFLKDKQYIYLTSVTQEFCEMTLNWFLSLKNIGSSHLALVVCADQQSYDYMLAHSIPCVYLNCEIQSNEKGEEWVENEKHFKLLGLYIIFKHYNVDIILSDVDIVFLKNPIEKLVSELDKNVDWLAMSDRKYSPFVSERKKGFDVFVSEDKKEIINNGLTPQTLYGEENGGFSYIPNPTADCRFKESSLAEKANKVIFLKTFQKDSPYYQHFPNGTEEGCLQTIVNKKTKETNLRVKMLSCMDFPNGSVWSVSYIREKIKNSCYLVHYNFCNFLDPIKVREEKTNRMKQHGHWYVT